MATIQNTLTLDWRIDVAPAGFLTLGMEPAQPPKDTRNIASRTHWSSYFQVDATQYILIVPTTITHINEAITASSFGTQPICLGYAGDFYYRIWVIPEVLRVLNPQLGLGYTFAIWNAFPAPNSLTVVGGTGQTGLTLNFTPAVAYATLEFKDTVTVTIDSSAPIEVNAAYIFTFTNGVGNLQFLASLAKFLDIAPAPPVVEHWDWLTDLHVSYEADEQRISHRDGPRFSQQFVLLIEGEDDRRLRYTQWLKSMGTDIIMPYPGHSAWLTVEAAAAATKLFFDPKRTDLRDGDFLILLDQASGTGELATIKTVDADGATLEAGIAAKKLIYTLVCPAFRSRLSQPSGPAMRSITGKIQVDSQALSLRTVFKRPGSTATINTFDGYNVLDVRPLSETDVTELFDAGYEVIDNKVGEIDIVTSWPHPFYSGRRTFLIQRFLDPELMDFWRDFLDAAKGRQNLFLFPTWRKDLTESEQPSEGSSQLKINNADYELHYFPNQTYKRLQIETSGGGILWRKVNSVVNNGDGTWTLELGTAIPVGFGTVDVISFLTLVRQGSDRVTLTHSFQTVKLSLVVKAVDA